jgi:hypothetical protein
VLNRRALIFGIAVSAALASPALANDYASRVEARLKKAGYTIESAERTLLGRVRIVALRGSGRREIILNPRTGEILRDLWIVTEDSDGGASPLGASPDEHDKDSHDREEDIEIEGDKKEEEKSDHGSEDVENKSGSGDEGREHD